jgi:phage terminase large subunit-like protein
MDNLTRQKLELAKLKRMHSVKLNSSFSASDPASRPTPAQQEFMDDIQHVILRWAVSSNRAGKTGTAAREAAWMFNNSHPSFTRPKKWGDGPILMLILGKKIEQLQTAIWESAIKPLLPPGTYHEKYGSSGLEKVINTQNGNTILFQSHNNPREARKNIQSYDIHWAWIDEMPESASLIGELVTRLVSINGRMCATFTPLVYNMEIKRMVEKAELPIGKRYFFSIFDNPANKDRIDEIIKIIRAGCATEDEFNCRVYGKWIGAGNRVSNYNPDRHKEEIPPYYTPLSWRHIASVDPSASGKTGLTIWGEDPTSGVWYNIKAKYMQGDAAFLLVQAVEEELAGFNITLRVCDSNPAGFWKEASRQGITYRTVGDQKYYGKNDFIDKANEALAKGQVKLTEASELLEDELITCTWSDNGDGRIVNASKYHVFDSMQYAISNLPKFDPSVAVVRTPDEWIRYNWKQQQATKAKKAKADKMKIVMKQLRSAAHGNRRRRLNAL